MVKRIGRRRRTILIIDKDLGFLMYLGGILCQAGYQAWPARNRREAQRLVQELRLNIDLVIAPSGMQVKGLTDTLVHHGKPPRLIVTQESKRTSRSEALDGAVGVIRKPSPRDFLKQEDWVEAVRAVLK